MSVRSWSFFSSKEKEKKWKQNILDTISLWAAIGLLWYAFVSILEEHLPISLHLWVIVPFVFLLWLGQEWPKQYLGKRSFLCRLAGGLIPVLYIVLQFARFWDGCAQIAVVYIPYVNYYYQTRFTLPDVSVENNSVVAFTAIAMLLWLVVWQLSYRWKKRVLLVLFPVLALAVELIVGLSAHGNGCVCLFLAAMLLLTMGGVSVLKRVLVPACVAACVFLAGLFWNEEIQSLTTKESKQALLDWQSTRNIENMNPFQLFQIDLHFLWETLNNHTPQYTGKVLLELESEQKPEKTLYLRGFYGTYYKNGNWTCDASAFETACKEAGKSEDEVAKAIFQMPYERITAYGTEYLDDYVKSAKHALRINYTGTTGDVAYVPYLSDYDTLDDDYSLSGDYLLKKSIWDDTIEVEGYALDYWAGLDWVSIIESVNKGNDWDENQEELAWINSLADAYLQVPENIDFLESAIEEVKSRVTKSENGNIERLRYANAVAEYLSEQMTYSLELDKLPAGRDPIDYALNESHEGYCMHFASTATLLLRELGVPARYISGYAVKPSAFTYEDGVYQAEVTDYMAHTWVEFYFDDIGWIPVEVTPGSSLNHVPTEEEIENWESLSDAHREQMNDQTENDSEDDTEGNVEDDTEEESGAVESEKDTSLPPKSDSTEDNRLQNASGQDNLWKVAAFAAGVGLLAVIGVFLSFGIKHTRKKYQEVLSKELEGNMTRKAVKHINRRLYRITRLICVRSWFRQKWNDTEYEKALIQYFADVKEEEWTKYMEIVKKNYYSKEKISTEEMRFCYECYRRVRLFNISLTKLWDYKK